MKKSFVSFSIRVVLCLLMILYIKLNIYAEQSELGENNEYRVQWTNIQLVPCDTVSFCSPITVVKHGLNWYAFENYPEGDYSRNTFDKMLEDSKWYFVDVYGMWHYYKPEPNRLYYDMILFDFEDDHWFTKLTILHDEYDFMIFRAPADILYFLALVQFGKYERSRPMIDYEGPANEVRRAINRDEIPPYKFNNSFNTFVRTLFPLEDSFRDKEERNKSYEENMRFSRRTIPKIY